tara:strand:+ start:332 stop:556 length:225 start_codon:yes stop_codon:yes gene_type:complete
MKISKRVKSGNSFDVDIPDCLNVGTEGVYAEWDTSPSQADMDEAGSLIHSKLMEIPRSGNVKSISLVDFGKARP